MQYTGVTGQQPNGRRNQDWLAVFSTAIAETKLMQTSADDADVRRLILKSVFDHG
jgi:hypothetical protein